MGYMKNKMITAKNLLREGFTQGKCLGVALEIAQEHYADSDLSKQEIAALFNAVRNQPELYLNDPIMGRLAVAFQQEAEKQKAKTTLALREQPVPFSIYGADQIEAGAINQMQTAMQLPVTVAGALMADAHQGYGLPIGGVLATHHAVIPYGVGVDIGCRMALSVFDIPEQYFFKHQSQFKRELIAHTAFGAGNGFTGKDKAYHPVLEHHTFKMNSLLRGLYDKAATQLGSSGGGNHFVEWGIIDFAETDTLLGIEKGRYVALLSHSGSRGLGASIAEHYTRLAKNTCKLPPEAVNLAWLDLDSEAGQEYWLAMQLAGEYAAACHEVIHRKLANAIGSKALATVENHHNFAWKEHHNGQEVIVHRKGATPAAQGVMGIIPGSMSAPGFLVRGKGNAQSLHSASHGAGRQMSRKQATISTRMSHVRAYLQEVGVQLIGGGPDEAPMAYKDIHKVMLAQTDLVEVVAKFSPKMVRMADDGSRED